jgi:hypothetical protein
MSPTLQASREHRRLRLVGLIAGAILASLALLGTSASTASAKEQVGVYLAGEASEEASKQPRFEAEKYTAHLVGSSTTAQKYGFAAGSWLECPYAEYFGKATAKTSELVLSPWYPFFACSASNGGAVTIKQNGCEHIMTVSNAGPPYVGKFGIKCPSGAPYQFTAGTCTISIPAQTALTGITYENTGSGKTRAVVVNLNVSGLKHSISCLGGMTFENGTLTGSFVLKGYDEP